MDGSVVSVNHVPIRLTDERWRHIVENHDDMAGHYYDVLETLADPDAVYEGNSGELLAVSSISRPRLLVVVYKETSSADGFVITAFFTTRNQPIERRRRLWIRP